MIISDEKVDNFLIFAKNIDCGDLLEPPQSNVYPQYMLRAKMRKKYHNFSPENYHFYSCEILQYIAWAYLRNVLDGFYFQMVPWKGLLVYILSCFLAAVYVQAQGKPKEQNRYCSISFQPKFDLIAQNPW